MSSCCKSSLFYSIWDKETKLTVFTLNFRFFYYLSIWLYGVKKNIMHKGIDRVWTIITWENILDVTCISLLSFILYFCVSTGNWQNPLLCWCSCLVSTISSLWVCLIHLRDRAGRSVCTLSCSSTHFRYFLFFFHSCENKHYGHLINSEIKIMFLAIYMAH